jgi:hypothetical protein
MPYDSAAGEDQGLKNKLDPGTAPDINIAIMKTLLF